MERDIAANRARGLAVEALTGHVVERLEAEGIRSLPLKGPLLARRLHGDEGLRATNDLDLLVDRPQIDAALAILREFGYEPEPLDPDLRADGLPDLHYTLRHPAGRLTRIELHWRIAWYEDDFSRDLLERADGTPPEPTPDDDLAALLVFYARDGLFGLRAPADIAAWWDRHGERVRSPVLARHWERYPDLRRAFVAAARAAERVAAVPAARVLPPEARDTTRPRLAVRLASWTGDGEIDQLAANVRLVDLLLSPPGGMGPSLRRHVFVTPRRLGEIYRLPEGASLRRGLWRALHPAKIGLRYLLGLAAMYRRAR